MNRERVERFTALLAEGKSQTDAARTLGANGASAWVIGWRLTQYGKRLGLLDAAGKPVPKPAPKPAPVLPPIQPALPPPTRKPHPHWLMNPPEDRLIRGEAWGFSSFQPPSMARTYRHRTAEQQKQHEAEIKERERRKRLLKNWEWNP